MSEKIFNKILKFTASIKLAVIVIVGLGVISAVGTIYEARYDAEVAQRLVYHSVYMYVLLGLLIVNLLGVMIDRWPWKQHHAGFVLAHIGIIVLLFGSWLTKRYGVDGTMVFPIGDSSRFVTVKERDLNVYASFGGEMQNMYSSEVDFLRHPPTEKKPFVVNLGQESMEFVEYLHFAYREAEIAPSSDLKDGPAIRFQLVNANVNMAEWIRRDRSKQKQESDLGPAKIVLTDLEPQPSGRNEIILKAEPEKARIRYVIFNKDGKMSKSGYLQQGEAVDTGWMGLTFRVLRFLPHAQEIVRYTPAPSGPLAVSAARFRFRGKEYWVGLNSALRVYLEDRMYIVAWGHRRLELDFPLQLLEFRMGKYEGTERASSYESEVEVPDVGRVVISMNEPLKHKGFTFYQASFERDDSGRPVISVLSVNHDPGRWVKYLGSLLIVLGAVILFYFKRTKWIPPRKAA